MTKIIYIAGYGYSGSTLCGVVLGDLKGHINVGEIRRLPSRKESAHLNRSCSNINAERARACIKAFIAKASPSLDQIAGIESIFSARARNDPRKVNYYNEFWQTIFGIISKETEADTLIDCSKTAWGQILRPQLLLDAGHDVYILHLVRNPQALVRSRSRKKGLMHGAKALLGWAVTNWLTRSRYKKWRSRYMISVYDDCVRDPKSELEAIGKFLGVDLLPSILRIAAGSEFDRGLLIGGNHAGYAQNLTWNPPHGRMENTGFGPRVIGAIGIPLFRSLKKQRLEQRLHLADVQNEPRSDSGTF